MIDLNATLSPRTVPESGLCLLPGNRGWRKLSIQDAIASQNHWLEPVSRATMEQGLNGTVMKHGTGLGVHHRKTCKREQLLTCVWALFQDCSSSQIPENALC